MKYKYLSLLFIFALFLSSCDEKEPINLKKKEVELQQEIGKIQFQIGEIYKLDSISQLEHKEKLLQLKSEENKANFEVAIIKAAYKEIDSEIEQYRKEKRSIVILSILIGLMIVILYSILQSFFRHIQANWLSKEINEEQKKLEKIKSETELLKLKQSSSFGEFIMDTKPENIEIEDFNEFDIITEKVEAKSKEDLSIWIKKILKLYEKTNDKENINSVTSLLNFSNTIYKRLETEIRVLSKHANTNLLICFFLAFCFVLALFYFLTSSSNVITHIDNWIDFLIFYMPRLVGIVGFATIFLYFVRLYSNNQRDIRFYHNEITNIDFKVVGLRTALLNDDKKTVASVISDFIKIERNMTIKEGETNVELEKIRAEDALNKHHIEQLWKTLDFSKLMTNKSPINKEKT